MKWTKNKDFYSGLDRYSFVIPLHEKPEQDNLNWISLLFFDEETCWQPLFSSPYSEEAEDGQFWVSRSGWNLHLGLPLHLSSSLRPNPHWTRAVRTSGQFICVDLMLLASSLNTPIHINRFHLLAFAPRVQCRLGHTFSTFLAWH